MFSLSLNLFCNIHLSQLFVICRDRDKWLFDEKFLSALTFLYLCMEMGNNHIFFLRINKSNIFMYMTKSNKYLRYLIWGHSYEI